MHEGVERWEACGEGGWSDARRRGADPSGWWVGTGEAGDPSAAARVAGLAVRGWKRCFEGAQALRLNSTWQAGAATARRGAHDWPSTSDSDCGLAAGRFSTGNAWPGSCAGLCRRWLQAPCGERTTCGAEAWPSPPAAAAANRASTARTTPRSHLRVALRVLQQVEQELARLDGPAALAGGGVLVLGLCCAANAACEAPERNTALARHHVLQVALRLAQVHPANGEGRLPSVLEVTAQVRPTGLQAMNSMSARLPAQRCCPSPVPSDVCCRPHSRRENWSSVSLQAASLHCLIYNDSLGPVSAASPCKTW